MNPKEQYLHLFDIFMKALPNEGYEFLVADDCVKICVQSILKALESKRIIYGSEYRFEESDFWEEVLKELMSV